MQQLLPKTLLLRHYEQILCEIVSEVGVDINKACSYDHVAGLLSFVPGLGPRKTANLRRTNNTVEHQIKFQIVDI